MSLKTKMDKINRIISTQRSKEGVIENLKPLELLFDESLDIAQEQCLYPNEPNFQIPNVFLTTKASSELKNFIKLNNSNADFNSSIDQVLDDLEGFDLFESESDQDKETIEEEVLNFIVKSRKGGI